MTLLSVRIDDQPETPALRTESRATITEQLAPLGDADVSVGFIHDDDGWVGTFDGSDISTKFPTFDELTLARA